MTREEKLISMNGALLIQVADKLGVKVLCNHTRTALKESKANVVKRIIEAEARSEENPQEVTNDDEAIITENEVTADNNVILEETPAEAQNDPVETPAEEPKEKKTRKRHNLKLREVTHNGETKTITAWAKEVGIDVATLYNRINRNGWPIDLAIETPKGMRRPK